MRIGLVTGEYPPMQGGIGAHCRELARELTAQGHRLFVYADSRATKLDAGIAVTRHRGQWDIGALRSINRWARDNRLDVVNLHFQTAAFQMSPFIHFLPDAVAVPVITTFHDLRFPYLFPKAGRLRDWIVMRLARASEGVVSTNFEDFKRLKHLPHAALIPIGSSVRAELSADFDRATVRAKYGATDEDYVVAHFGFINHSKGVDRLVGALRALLDGGMPARLWLVGGKTGASDPTNAAVVQQIEALAASLGVVGAITWTGFLDDGEVAACFAACDVVALPYRDGASYRRSSLMAAIGHGTAILTTEPTVDIPAFRSGINLHLIARQDGAESLAHGLKTLYADPVYRDSLRAGAQELANEFAWDAIARANAEFFARVVSGQ